MPEMVLRNCLLPAHHFDKQWCCLYSHRDTHFCSKCFDQACLVPIDDIRTRGSTAQCPHENHSRRRPVWKDGRTPLYPEKISLRSLRGYVTEPIQGKWDFTPPIPECGHRD